MLLVGIYYDGSKGHAGFMMYNSSPAEIARFCAYIRQITGVPCKTMFEKIKAR